MDKITEKAGLVAARVVRAGKAEISPLLVVAVVSTIIQAVFMWKQCKGHWQTPQQAAARGRAFFRERVRRLARRELLRQHLDQSDDAAVADEVLGEMAKMSDGEIQTVIAEVK